MFFAPNGERSATLRQREARAKCVCAQCPVQTACHEHALIVGKPYEYGADSPMKAMRVRRSWP